MTAVESAEEHGARVIAPLLDKIRDDRLPAAELPIGCAVWVEGTCWGFDGMLGNQMLLSDGRTGITYTPGPDDRFEWRSPF